MSMEMHTPQSLHAIHGIGDQPRRGSASRWLGSCARQIARIRLAITRELATRRAAAELERMDERALNDIGLQRADIKQAIHWMRANRRLDIGNAP
ncbi:DUF1127 domain-containing protein [Bosea caraganae]|uniref:DUF1127 domain-containing protein n=1 Tax=Bosea caraganae TaxID=2763117 RepID=A0A370L9F5_9HYPH|nr:DUF1127 domain-containing protein [Bosea caraganae]RDJ22018.1 DUF1127 domain-containing protein [Bosea caraganae]RDJ27948.1 DUF1127 domain-containing protein [Bosea caraganae]